MILFPAFIVQALIVGSLLMTAGGIGYLAFLFLRDARNKSIW